MGFKTDREFLRNISIGAVGTIQVATLLNANGYRVIELERYSSSNKIWATKIKRLRVPDLICLQSGIRIESRAKSTLALKMSHALNNPDRAWDSGLRDDDLVAFILCTQDEDGHWHAANRMSLFRVSDMRSCAAMAGLSARKAASEGSELQLEWKATIPKTPGKVTEIQHDRIVTELVTGRRQSYRLGPKRVDGQEYYLTCYANVDDEFGEGDTILASSIPNIVTSPLTGAQYDFIPDLSSSQRETVYAAAKALGFLSKDVSRSREPLSQIAIGHENILLRLEAAAALARLGEGLGWAVLGSVSESSDEPIDARMESVLILSEMRSADSARLLGTVADNTSNPSELRAAATWGLSQVKTDLKTSGLVARISDDDEVTASHAIAGATRLISPATISEVVSLISDDPRESAGLVRAIVSSGVECVPEVRDALNSATGARRQWLLYLLACLGREKCGGQLDTKTMKELDFYWTYHKSNWTNRLDVADQIDFLLEQILK